MKDLPDAPGEDSPPRIRSDLQEILHGMRQLSEEVAALRAERDEIQREVAALRNRLAAAEAQVARREALVEKAAEFAALARALGAAWQSEASGFQPAGAPTTSGALSADAPSPPGPSPTLGRGEAVAPSRRGGWGASPARWETRVITAITVLVMTVVLALTVGPRLLPYQTYVVLSGSMQPTLPVGAVVVLFPAAAERLAVGDIITFQRPDRPSELVTHRIVGLEQGPTGRFFVTKGDANGVPDAWRVPAVGNGWRYAFAIPNLGYVLRAFHSSEGRLAFLIVPAIGLGLVSLVENRRPRKQAIESV